jgi:hypothetical protein
MPESVRTHSRGVVGSCRFSRRSSHAAKRLRSGHKVLCIWRVPSRCDRRSLRNLGENSTRRSMPSATGLPPERVGLPGETYQVPWGPQRYPQSEPWAPFRAPDGTHCKPITSFPGWSPARTRWDPPWRRIPRSPADFCQAGERGSSLWGALGMGLKVSSRPSDTAQAGGWGFNNKQPLAAFLNSLLEGW